MEKIAADINTLAAFCGVRDLERLSPKALRARGLEQADVLVLFGGSILAGGDELLRAMAAGAAKKYLIVGGEGHTTEALRRRVREELGIETAGLSEAEVFNRYLLAHGGRGADALEKKSTNCGNNITLMLELLRREKIPCRSIILMQDATMQRRMAAGLEKHAPEILAINYAAYRAEVTAREGKLAFKAEPHGMWTMERYVSLLMGEIPRLTDDAEGYGPRGKGFIAHVEVPESVRAAFLRLKKVFKDGVRPADSRYA